MPTSSTSEAASEVRGVAFALDSFDVADGRLVVAGRWYGVVGRRFVRPVLQAQGQRRLIAVLDHKPWVPEEGGKWLAAFPHDGSIGPSRLQVAPDIAVELPAAGPQVGDGIPRPARLTRAPEPQASPPPEPAAAEKPPRARKRPKQDREAALAAARVEAERDAALAEVEAIRGANDEARADVDRLRAELDHARRESERLETELAHARTDLDRLRAELSQVRAEANTLRQASDEARARAERLEVDANRLRVDAHRAMTERNEAQSELERVSRAPARGPYIAPRPVPFGQLEPRPNWPLRVVAAVMVIALLGALVQLLFGVL